MVTNQPRAQRRSIDNWPPLIPMLEAIPTSAVSPMASGAALAQRGEGSRAIALIGVDLDRYRRVAALSEKIIAGRFRLGPGEAIIGRELAEDLGVQLGDVPRRRAGPLDLPTRCAPSPSTTPVCVK